MRGQPLWPPAVSRLAARPSQSNPRGSGPGVLKRERGHMTTETGVAEVAVFGAIQPNDIARENFVHKGLLYPPLQWSWKRGILVSPCPSVCLSVCGQNCVCSVSSTILIGSISYLHILSRNFRRCVACDVCFKIQKIEILATSLNL